ncbi:uncharacterized protein LOC106877488 [Octopus bimaculoides]|uniref:uncharacterized protein LOC106877488 n=1 Tax=Octopus bimaculoides TaxID=37653 RepID=UPI0022E74F11|nr:uncharacterized protein LOC106877488 [Octopus bimaculoides]XP_052821977.1 uncharacterized protein LOC106877488 [Octopus bimaculoides]
MTSVSKTLKYIDIEKSSAKDILDRCRYKRELIDDDLQYLYNDLYKYKKRFQRAYHNQFCNDYMETKNMKGIVDLQIYPRGVRTAHFPLYTTEGDRLPIGRPAAGALYEKSVITSNGRQYRFYSVAL